MPFHRFLVLICVILLSLNAAYADNRAEKLLNQLPAQIGVFNLSEPAKSFSYSVPSASRAYGNDDMQATLFLHDYGRTADNAKHARQIADELSRDIRWQIEQQRQAGVYQQLRWGARDTLTLTGRTGRQFLVERTKLRFDKKRDGEPIVASDSRIYLAMVRQQLLLVRVSWPQSMAYQETELDWLLHTIVHHLDQP